MLHGTAMRVRTGILYSLRWNRIAVPGARSAPKRHSRTSNRLRGDIKSGALGWFRARVRAVAAATLVSFVGLGGLSSAAHGADCHDDECAVALLSHDPTSHGIGNGSSDAVHPVHCILCHWTRSTRPSTESVHPLARPVTETVLLQPEVLGGLSLVQAAQPPLRSPPL